MADHPPVYTDHDRHQVLMKLAKQVTDHAAANPHPNDYNDYDGVPNPTPHPLNPSK